MPGDCLSGVANTVAGDVTLASGDVDYPGNQVACGLKVAFQEHMHVFADSCRVTVPPADFLG